MIIEHEGRLYVTKPRKFKLYPHQREFLRALDPRHDFRRTPWAGQERYTFSRGPAVYGLTRERRTLRIGKWLYTWIWWRDGDA